MFIINRKAESLAILGAALVVLAGTAEAQAERPAVGHLTFVQSAKSCALKHSDGTPVSSLIAGTPLRDGDSVSCQKTADLSIVALRLVVNGIEFFVPANGLAYVVSATHEPPFALSTETTVARALVSASSAAPSARITGIIAAESCFVKRGGAAPKTLHLADKDYPLQDGDLLGCEKGADSNRIGVKLLVNDGQRSIPTDGVVYRLSVQNSNVIPYTKPEGTLGLQLTPGNANGGRATLASENNLSTAMIKTQSSAILSKSSIELNGNVTPTITIRGNKDLLGDNLATPAVLSTPSHLRTGQTIAVWLSGTVVSVSPGSACLARQKGQRTVTPLKVEDAVPDRTIVRCRNAGQQLSTGATLWLEATSVAIPNDDREYIVFTGRNPIVIRVHETAAKKM